MSLPPFNNLPAWAMFFSLAEHFAAGIVIGMLYFHSIWWAARQLVAGNRTMLTIALTILRFAVLGAVLTLASKEGALPLLILASGLLIARSLVIRRVQEAIS